ncbi:sensor histidine kinase [Sinanaerobacter chloroacetimidivorans]|jgi:two-component system sensor histidine kinase CiaH|uniref:histidine kinase n=1 Tax=Sinanaerobacter chloroacetimidivorans TaxID=2818044 RepID=A0A8J8B3I5_9FIRM|nr:HAMP domain-containing sensor histidine kinase [Sinanaerobacter chloroacetimidivorans]MBR0598360.1 two-component sensor histidine kinase [Sinanaerobacter chloroacetimidivorans]
MIKKLRKKFILINMTLISVVMVIVFLAICMFYYQWSKAETYEVMDKVISMKGGMEPRVFEIGGRGPRNPEAFIPTFTVLLDSNHEIQTVGKDRVSISDESIEEVTQLVLASGKIDGTLLDFQLRFLTRQTPEGFKIVFADMGREIESMTNMVTMLVFAGIGGLAAFFFINLYLSGWALRPVEKAWEQQRQFVADASHELKTPLTVILANTGILLSHPHDTISDQKKWVEYTQAEANRMKKLVDDLLFLAKSDAYRAPALVQTNVNFTDAVWSCLLPFESYAYEQGISIESNIAPDITLQGDEGQLKQLVVILLDNACKYAGAQGTVTFSLERKNDQIRLSVNNTGVPISQKHLDHIFERFYRSDSARAREHGGFGLGLAIAKAIVDNHHGRISVESNQAAGTTFTVIFSNKS